MRVEARRTYEQLYLPTTNCRALLDIYRDAIDLARQPLTENALGVAAVDATGEVGERLSTASST
jgi:hypothetical protein